MTPEEEVIRSERARQLLEEPLLKEAFSLMESGLINGIQVSALKDQELREKCCQMLIAVREVKQHLQSTMETGVFATKTLEQRSAWQRAKSVWGAN